MTFIWGKLQVAYRLGLGNILRVFFYRITVKFGINPVRRLKATLVGAPFFYSPVNLGSIDAPAVSTWNDYGLLFSYWLVKIDKNPPDWFYDSFTGGRFRGEDREWWKIPDFDPGAGDIKCIWEISRYDWVLAFAQRARQGDAFALKQLNEWLGDWCECNPPYVGPNWKCGQEASIRVMHLAMAALIMGQIDEPAEGLINLLRVHLQRIAPTIQYAIAQDNNHGTSEAAALFIGGSWLHALGDSDGKILMQSGRKWLENRAARLIGRHGSFSQYSLNYHRVMLDTFCMVEVWRRNLNLEEFSNKWLAKMQAATEWMRHMVNQFNGDGPSVGANDGARLLQLTNTEYRDFRPTVQLSTALFFNQRAYAPLGSWDDALIWLGIDLPSSLANTPRSYIADDGGFAMLRKGKAMAMLRYPRFTFRPGQCDALHLDLWVGAKNLLFDGGSYSYNADPKLMAYFGGTSSHNTVQFDERDQMPRYGRFLLGDWLKTKQVELPIDVESDTHFGACYEDDFGATHSRSLSLTENFLEVHDRLFGFKDKAVVRWRLPFASWIVRNGQDCIEVELEGDSTVRIKVWASVPISRCELVVGWKSLHYLEKSPVSVLEVETLQPGSVWSEIRWS
jgi:hypothetical protein